MPKAPHPRSLRSDLHAGAAQLLGPPLNSQRLGRLKSQTELPVFLRLEYGLELWLEVLAQGTAGVPLRQVCVQNWTFSQGTRAGRRSWWLQLLARSARGESCPLALTSISPWARTQARKEGFLVSGLVPLHTQCMSGCPSPTQPRHSFSGRSPSAPCLGRLCLTHLSPTYLPRAGPQDSAGERAVNAGRRHRPTPLAAGTLLGNLNEVLCEMWLVIVQLQVDPGVSSTAV